MFAPEKDMKYFLDQLKRITSECGSHPVFVLTPWPRFARVPCCDDGGHVTNFNDPDFLASLLSDLTKFKYQLRKAVTPAIVVDSLELICGNGYSHEKVSQTISAGWASDPVHPNKHIYAKAALNLVEKMANNKPAASGSGIPQNRKRTWSASNTSDSSGPSGRHGGGGGDSKPRQFQWQRFKRAAVLQEPAVAGDEVLERYRLPTTGGLSERQPGCRKQRRRQRAEPLV